MLTVRRPPGATLRKLRKGAMNRFILTSALALTAMVLGQQRASAWCEFKFNHTCNLCYTSTGHNWNFSSQTNGPACTAPCYQGNPGYQGYQGYPPPQPPPMVPPPTPVQKSGYEGWNNSGYQPVGYYYYPQAGYGFYQAPSYWYGR